MHFVCPIGHGGRLLRVLKATVSVSEPPPNVVYMEQPRARANAAPRSVEPLLSEPELALAWEQQVIARRAEAAKFTALLDFQQRVVAEYRHHGIPPTELTKDTTREAARLLGISDMTAGVILDAIGFARSYLPATWTAFTQGQIDLPRLRKIVSACCELDDAAARAVEARAAEEAAARSTSEFTHWLNRHIAHTDYEAYMRLGKSNRRRRHVRFEHLPNGMSFVSAFLPTLQAAAIEKRLKVIARRQRNTEPTEPTAPESLEGPERPERPTLAEYEADLFSAWLRTTRSDDPDPVEAKIMVMIPESTLTGQSDEPGLSADRSWALPADQARALASYPGASHEWYIGRARPRPTDADMDLLSVSYAGRQPPPRLRDAVIFRDGCCQTPGCTIPAERCDLDHQTPWDAGGKTTGKNLWALCRRHHRLKSHGFLHPPARGDTSRPYEDDLIRRFDRGFHSDFYHPLIALPIA